MPWGPNAVLGRSDNGIERGLSKRGTMRAGLRNGTAAILAVWLFLPGFARGAEPSGDGAEPEVWAFHAQTTFTEQFHPAFRSPYVGANSLDPAAEGRETWDATLYGGVRPWDGGELWVNGEVDQGFGLSNTLGVSGFPSGEAYKVGKAVPYLKLPRLFFRQTIGLGGESENVDPDLNQLGGAHDKNRIVLTIGKYSVIDVFDHNAYSDDPRHNLLNWAIIDQGTFDYAANAWGYTYGAAAEWYQDWWTLRAGIFDLSNVPNSTRLEEAVLRQFQIVTEAEERHTLWGESGSVRLLAFLSHGRMGLFKDAIALSDATHEPASTALVRHLHVRAGIGMSADQSLTDDLGAFLRAGYADPSREPYEFTDYDASVSGGLALHGKSWGRADDTVDLAFEIGGISREHADYFDHGGLGILSGDGKLPHRGLEKIVELQYQYAPFKWLAVSPDYQFVIDPAFNRDRGPVSILGIRLHAEY